MASWDVSGSKQCLQGIILRFTFLQRPLGLKAGGVQPIVPSLYICEGTSVIKKLWLLHLCLEDSPWSPPSNCLQPTYRFLVALVTVPLPHLDISSSIPSHFSLVKFHTISLVPTQHSSRCCLRLESPPALSCVKALDPNWSGWETKATNLITKGWSPSGHWH